MSSRRSWRPLVLGVLAGALGVIACGGNAGLGESCDSLSDCSDGLQCLNHICVPRCARHVDCGDGHMCRADGICQLVESEVGDVCAREVDCGPGQSCQLAGEDDNGDDLLTASCQPEQSGGLLDDGCAADADCRTGTCVIGRCVDVCLDDLDCPLTHTCTRIPRELGSDEDPVASFHGCLPASGTITYQVPISSAYERFFVPVPENAVSVSLIAEIDDATQLVGAARIEAPDGTRLYKLPFSREEYFDNRLRHAPASAISTILIPQTPDDPLVPGAYVVELGSYVDLNTPGTEIPTVDVVYKLDDEVHLDLHFHFLDLAEHPCGADPDFDDGVLSAATAQTSDRFQDTFLGELNLIFASGGVTFDREDATYTDILDRPDLDGLDVSRLGDLLALSTHDDGVNVFFVRSISPAGLQGLVGGPPGPPMRAGTRASGVAIALDTLCYRDWTVLARTVAHEVARSIGLERTVEPDGFVDAISDTDTDSGNLLYFSEFGDTELSALQRDILHRSAALQEASP